MKNRIRITESDLHKIVKESVKRVLNEDSYRKAAKKGEHTSSQLKHELNYQQRNGTYNPKDYHKFANKHGLNKMDVNTVCDFEDGRDYEIGQFRNNVWDVINDTLKKTFSNSAIGVGNGWDVTNPDNEDEYVHITFDD